MKKDTRLIFIFAIIKFLIPFIFISSAFELHRDEYLYLADADHLAWGYLEMPPLLALLGAISKLMGGSFFAVYFWGALLGALTMILVGKIVQELKGNTFAIGIACMAFLTSAYLRINILFQPNSLDGFFWTLAVYSFIRLIHSGNYKYLYYIGISFGLGLLSKYTMGFFIAGFLVSILGTEQRKWLKSIHFYASMLLALLIVLPNFLWQYNHYFPVLHHMDMLENQQLKYTSRIDFMIAQLIMFMSSFYIWILALWFIGFKKEGKAYRSIGIIWLVVILLFLWLRGKPYYAASIYPSLLAIGSVYLASILQQKGFKLFRFMIPAYMLLATLLFFPVAIPFLSPEKLDVFYQFAGTKKLGLLDWEERKNNPLPQDFADMLGWKEMAEKTAKVYHALPDSIQKQTMVYGDNYGDAGALAFYRKQLGMPEIYSDDASFGFWLPNKFTYKYFLFACRNMPDADDSFFYHFKRTEILDSVTQHYSREYRAKIVLYSLPDDTAVSIANRHTAILKRSFNLIP